jgi:hypothetical protein
MNKGDIVICITINYYNNLILDKHYVVENSYGGYITIVGDDSEYAYHAITNFKPLSEYREEQLNKIL